MGMNFGMQRNAVMNRSKPMTRVAMPRKQLTAMPGPRINRVGPRTKAWIAVWRWLKPRLETAHRTECEFDFIPHNCFGPLDPAHSKKRNKMTGNDIYAVAISCRNMHRVLDEVYSHAAMEQAVMFAIERSGGLILPAV